FKRNPYAGPFLTIARRNADGAVVGIYSVMPRCGRRHLQRNADETEDTGGGWFNGRGDDSMTMLQGYAHMVDFFTSFDWWKTDHHDELATSGNYCLAKPGEIYAVYLPRGGNVTLRLQPGQYHGTWWNPSTGEKTALPPINATASSWISPPAPGS